MKKFLAPFFASLLFASSALAQIAPSGSVFVMGNAVASSNSMCVNSSGSVVACAPGTAQRSVSAPTAPASTSAYAMQGLAGSITPARGGNVLITICGTLIAANTTINDGILLQISYGTSTAPSNAAALTGTQVGSVMEYTNPAAVTAADVHVPFCLSAVVTGLTAGTAYWLDLAAKSVTTASDTGLSNVSISAIEI